MPSGRLDLLLHVIEVVLQLRMDRVLVVDAGLDGVHVRRHRRLNRTWKMLGVRVRRRPTSWLWPYWCVPSVTTGVTVKFSVGGGEGISHSSPLAPRRSAGAFRPATIEW